uniref:Uncharacterized protein n=1 Tax=Cucumis melo TaxID=3656 RepID=A0A9I9EH83_CUCME
MALQRVKIVFDGRWIESSPYIDYRVLDTVDDKHVSWIMLVISKFSDNDLLVVVDTVSATDIGNTPYLREDGYSGGLVCHAVSIFGCIDLKQTQVHIWLKKQMMKVGLIQTNESWWKAILKGNSGK